VSRLSYVVITPARNEAHNLPRLAASLAAQTVLPEAWCICENGSSDDTLELAESLAREHEWIRAATAGAGDPNDRIAPIAGAVHVGLGTLDRPVDVVCVIDADVSLEEGYVERLLTELEDDPTLGIVSGSCFEFEDGDWRQRHVTGATVWGAARAYRRTCLEAVLPFAERTGWDVVDVLRANARGWRTGTLVDLPFFHHRFEGSRDTARGRWIAQGHLAHYLGYRFSYVLLRTLHRLRQDRAAWALLGGYVQAAWRRRPTCGDDAVKSYLRREQSLRRLPVRAGEALGIRR
jgi:glycosyltransferase involved in cell wall biosynthesis